MVANKVSEKRAFFPTKNESLYKTFFNFSNKTFICKVSSIFRNKNFSQFSKHNIIIRVDYIHVFCIDMNIKSC